MWESGNIISKGSAVHLVDKKAKEHSSLFIGIRLKLGIKLDNKCRGDCRE